MRKDVYMAVLNLGFVRNLLHNFAVFCAFIAHIFCANFSSSTFFPFHFSNLLLLFIKCSAIFKYLDTQIVLKEKF